MATKTYDPTKIVVTLGTFILSGFGENSMVKAARKEDSYKSTVGAQGDVVRNKSANHMGEVDITLLSTSASNGVLSALVLADEAADAGMVPLLIKDLNGTALAAAAEAWVVKPADIEKGKEQKDKEWKIACADLELFDAGY